MSIYNLGIVNIAHIHQGDNEPKDHMHCHIYSEGVAGKGSNNVASLIMKTLDGLNLLHKDDCGGELNIIFDNCSGQNKNNTVLKLVPFLLEMGYFKQVRFVFLVVGHTKNSADMLFNALKSLYQVKDSNSVDELLEHLRKSKRVTVNLAAEDDFLDWDDYLKRFYSSLTGKIKSNHIFSLSQNSWEKNSKGIKSKLNMEIKESDLDDALVIKHNCIKHGFERDESLIGPEKLEQALLDRKKFMIKQKDETLRVLDSTGLNLWKAVMLYKNYRQHVDIRWQDITCPEPSKEQWDAFKADTVRNIEKQKLKLEQNIQVKEESKKRKAKGNLKEIKTVGKNNKNKEAEGN